MAPKKFFSILNACVFMFFFLYLQGKKAFVHKKWMSSYLNKLGSHEPLCSLSFLNIAKDGLWGC